MLPAHIRPKTSPLTAMDRRKTRFQTGHLKMQDFANRLTKQKASSLTASTNLVAIIAAIKSLRREIEQLEDAIKAADNPPGAGP